MNAFDPDPDNVAPGKGDLGFEPSAFPGTPVTRSAIYRAAIADRTASAEQRAFALYRAVKCYESSGYNHCGSPDAPKAERHAWYDALKTDYPGSRWAKQLRLWW